MSDARWDDLQRLDALDRRLTEVSTNVASIMDNHAEHHERLDDAWTNVETRIAALEAAIDGLDMLEAIKGALDTYSANMERLEAMIIALQDGKKYTGDR